MLSSFFCGRRREVALGDAKRERGRFAAWYYIVIYCSIPSLSFRYLFVHLFRLVFFVARDVIIFIVFVVIFVGSAARIHGPPWKLLVGVGVEFGMVHGEVLQAFIFDRLLSVTLPRSLVRRDAVNHPPRSSTSSIIS